MMHSFAAAAPSRFAGSARWPARVILLFLLLLTVQGLSESSAPAPVVVGAGAQGEHAQTRLHQRVIEGVRAGGRYHHVAVREHQEAAYPPSTVRLPTLAWVHFSLPPLGPAILLYALIAATLGAWAWRLSIGGLPVQRAALGSALLLAGGATLLLPELLVWHECWAALLIALSLALRSERRYGLSALAALAGAAFGEQAILFPLIMLAFSLHQRRAGETVAWGAVILVMACYLVWHAGETAAAIGIADKPAPAWLGSGGWDVAVTMVQMTGPLRLMPHWVGALIVPVAIVGWAGWQNETGARGAVFLLTYLLLLASIGDADNFGLALLIAPLLPVGLLFAPGALADLVRASVGTEARTNTPASLST
jgi:hypothetical protein